VRRRDRLDVWFGSVLRSIGEVWVASKRGTMRLVRQAGVLLLETSGSFDH